MPLAYGRRWPASSRQLRYAIVRSSSSFGSGHVSFLARMPDRLRGVTRDAAAQDTYGRLVAVNPYLLENSVRLPLLGFGEPRVRPGPSVEQPCGLPRGELR